MKRVNPILNQPFPYDNQVERQRTAIIFGVFVAGFLAMFQPFGFHQLPEGRKLWHALAYGGVTWGLMSLRFALQHWIGDRFGWTLRVELLASALNLLAIAAGNLLVGQLLGDFSVHPTAFFVMVGYTLAIGILPLSGLALVIYYRTLARQVASAAHVQERLQTDAVALSRTLATATLRLQLAGKEELVVAPANLLAATAAENYVNLMYLDRGLVRHKLLRGTMGQLTAALAGHPQFVRTHRAWIVNLAAVQRVDGNAQGYLLTLRDLPQPVPVARRMADAFEAALAQVGRTAEAGASGMPSAAYPRA